MPLTVRPALRDDHADASEVFNGALSDAAKTESFWGKLRHFCHKGGFPLIVIGVAKLPALLLIGGQIPPV
jgi:hypothetical protein